MARRAAKTSPSPSDLDARKATILEAVVAEHIDTAQPVGSSSVAHSADVDVSPATVRSEMVALEREGYLAQPHTSAGRVPTDKGYRYFVDHLKSGVLSSAQQYQVLCVADDFGEVLFLPFLVLVAPGLQPPLHEHLLAQQLVERPAARLR